MALIVSGLDLHRLAGLDRFANDEAGVVAPVGFAAGDAVVGAVGEAGFAFALPLANELGGNVGEQRGRGRGTPLVGDNAEAVALGSQFEHGLGEVATMGADDPAGTQDQVARVGVCQRKFAVTLGKAVDALRVGWIGLRCRRRPSCRRRRSRWSNARPARRASRPLRQKCQVRRR